jgi:hypothetical protein
MVLLTLPLRVAVITVVPITRDVARPEELIVATLGLELAQVTFVVILAVELSAKVPAAINCWARPRAIDGSVGVILIDTRLTIFTVAFTGVAGIVVPFLSPSSAIATVMVVLSPTLPRVVMPK